MKCSLFLFLLLPGLLPAIPDGGEAEKKITREFAIQANGRLTIDNRYGDLDIAIGESNKIKFDITIRANSGNDRKAAEAIDRVHIDFSEGFNRVDARTVIDKSASWTSWFGSSSQEMEINYQVLVPADIYLELHNRYGNIFLEKTDRDAQVEIEYGDIRLGDINAKLSLDMAYSEGSISQIRQGEFDLSYAELEMEDSDALSVEMKYTDLAMGSSARLQLVSSYGDFKGMDIDELVYSGKYDDLEIDRVKTIDAESGYTGIRLHGLEQTGEFDMRYGDLSIDHIGRGFNRLNINASYTGVALSFVPGTSFGIDAETNYCDIQHTDLQVTMETQEGASSTLKGNRGTGGGMLFARMNYGELTIE